jgi:hypothetical protein
MHVSSLDTRPDPERALQTRARAHDAPAVAVALDPMAAKRGNARRQGPP